MEGLLQVSTWQKFPCTSCSTALLPPFITSLPSAYLPKLRGQRAITRCKQKDDNPEKYQAPSGMLSPVDEKPARGQNLNQLEVILTSCHCADFSHSSMAARSFLRVGQQDRRRGGTLMSSSSRGGRMARQACLSSMPI